MRIRKIIFAMILCTVGKLFAQGYPVFDNMGWLAAIDRFYQGYDQIMNTLTMIEQNYNQMQKAYERAKSWNFESLDFNDGNVLQNIDIRDEIRDAGTQINRELTNIRQIKEAFEAKNLVMNGHTYSLKDLAGIGDKDRTLVDIVADTVYETYDSVQEAAVKFAQGVTEEEATLLYQKYGLSPKNFAMVKSVDQMMQKAVTPIFAWADEHIADVINAKDKEKLALVDGILERLLDQDGDSLTQSQIEQANAMLLKLSLDQIRELTMSLRSAAAYTAWRDRYNDEVKAAKEKEDKQYTIITEDWGRHTQEIF